MEKVRSISGDWMRITARQAYPGFAPRVQIEKLAEDLGISRRSAYAYVSEERRVPEGIEERFIRRFGEPAPDAWREVTLYAHSTSPNVKRSAKKPGPVPGALAAYRDNWRINAQNHARALAEGALGHRLTDWWQNELTNGQVAMIEHNLDEEEARERYPYGFEALAVSDDWAVECRICGLVGAVDDRLQEVNGMVFRVTCGTNSHKVGA